MKKNKGTRAAPFIDNSSSEFDILFGDAEVRTMELMVQGFSVDFGILSRRRYHPTKILGQKTFLRWLVIDLVIFQYRL